MVSLANADLLTLAAGLGLVLLSLIGLVVLRTMHRRRLPVAMQEPEQTPTESSVEVVRAAEPAALESVEGSLEVRALRAQVRCLEQALELLPEQVPAAPVDAAATVASYRAQVRATVRAVASECTAGADARYVVARLSAALDRLEQTGGLTRPALPGPVTLAAAPVVAVVSPAAQTPDPSVELPAVEPVQETAPETAGVAQVEEDEQVVPVPPPAVEATRRERRRLRRTAA